MTIEEMLVSDLPKLLRAVRALPWKFGRPATTASIAKAAKHLSCSFPTALAALYRDHDGVKVGGVRPWRLMSLREVSEFHKFVVELGWAGSGIRVFWTDDNSNYAGVYVEGPLTGHVAYVDHDEVDLSPVFSSVESFLAKLRAGAVRGIDWHDMDREPAPRSRNRRTKKASPLDALRAKLAAATDPDARARLAMSIMKVTPLDETQSIVPFLDEEDMYVQERACEILGERKYEPAIEKLARVVTHGGMGNGVTAAMSALGHIGTAPCRQALRAAAPKIHPGFATYVAQALVECGCEVEEVDDDRNWRVRFPGETRWKWLLPRGRK